jgi:hypothetical protein
LEKANLLVPFLFLNFIFSSGGMYFFKFIFPFRLPLNAKLSWLIGYTIVHLIMAAVLAITKTDKIPTAQSKLWIVLVEVYVVYCLSFLCLEVSLTVLTLILISA